MKTFDDTWPSFQGSCQYIAARDHCPDGVTGSHPKVKKKPNNKKKDTSATQKKFPFDHFDHKLFIFQFNKGLFIISWFMATYSS